MASLIKKSISINAFLLLPLAALAQGTGLSEAELNARIEQLESELAQLKAEKAEISQELEIKEAALTQAEESSAPITLADGEGGIWTIGGAIRANYTLGDYSGGNNPNRGGHGGNFGLDVFRINVDYSNGPWSGKMEYRFYDGYNFFHTLYGAYNFEDESVLKVGLNRAPFGVGAYGPANSWFFDQHYYVGLSDDMDYGISYTKTSGEWTFDAAVYLAAENNWRGSSADSARYSYDIVDTGAVNAHYRERGQLNLRAVRSFAGTVPTDIGASAQIGLHKGDDLFADDTTSYAFAVHSTSSWENWGLKTQLSYYNYNADYTGIDGSNDDLIAMGAYDYAAAVASEGVIPSIAINYLWVPKDIPWIDSINFYNDFSVIMKRGEMADRTDFNDSAMNVIGMAIARGNWYIYVDYALSNGNYFVGNSGDFGANVNDDWQKRFNINFGYYF
ncbi:MAG: hypothetical protein JW739_08600 [Opitutales bacterium]|nr:hypothetical protein [Opitutales bacterium]